MEEYGKILLIAMPVFTLLIIIEKIYGYWKGEPVAPLMDTISSISSGVTNTIKDILGLSVSLITYKFMVTHIALFHIKESVLAFVIAFIAIDFHGYWWHRFAHQINFFWNKHAIHHSSEEFDLPCALRQSVSSFVNLFTVFLLPAALLGVPASVVNVVLPLHLFAQFWYHTRYIGKMGFLEYFLVTPSHHRVHHAINPEYMDKNLGQIFIVWDKWFGTFQAELPDVPCVYGITRPAQTWNPIKINFQHLWLLITDAWRTEKWEDKLKIWFMPTGWRPEDVAERYPVYKIMDVYHFEKYGQERNKALERWALVQLLVTFAIISFFFGNIKEIGSPGIFIYGAFVFVTVYSYTELMDRKVYSLVWEGIRFVFAVGILLAYGDWFGLSRFVAWGNWVIIGYLLSSLGVNAYFALVSEGFVGGKEGSGELKVESGKWRVE